MAGKLESNSMNTFLTQREAAEYLRLSSRTLERMRLAGTGPQFRRFGRRVTYAVQDIREWADDRAFQSTAEADAAEADAATAQMPTVG